MIKKVFAVRDAKAEFFLQPFFCVSVGEALRAFGDAANEEKTPISTHPGDYVLYELGTWDDGMGKLDSLELVRMLATGSDFVKPTAQMTMDFGSKTEVLNGKEKA